jgi:hypothetical protein
MVWHGFSLLGGHFPPQVLSILFTTTLTQYVMMACAGVLVLYYINHLRFREISGPALFWIDWCHISNA